MIDLAITVGAAISTGITVGSAVYAYARDARVKKLDEDCKFWQEKHDQSRDEIHVIRAEWQGDKLELERLRVETNFAPLEKKLDGFIDAQRLVNDALSDTCKSMSENLKMLTNLMGRLVPALVADEERNQEEKI